MLTSEILIRSPKKSKLATDFNKRIKKGGMYMGIVKDFLNELCLPDKGGLLVNQKDIENIINLSVC
ncbi:hypothetical protein BSG8_25510 [Bacillus subtilis subsp. natto]|nr:hypothetical protein BSG8_25510 [Bacillus subtilis subsp. natto]BEH06616.1 hypothetical protein BSNN_26490 [Bacillus subtilis subsp. natto]